MAVDWTSHKAHRKYVAEKFGQWVGLVDENGEPMFTAPPVVSQSAPKLRNEAGAIRVTFRVRSPQGVVHPLVDELIGQGLGDVDREGVLVVHSGPSRFLVIEKPGGVRLEYRITHAVASGQGSAPYLLEVHGVQIVRTLSLLPSMSAPTTWQNNWTEFTRDWVGPEDELITFDRPRNLTGIKMVTVADGATISGPAESSIRRMINMTLEACFRVMGVMDDPPIRVNPTPTGVHSENVLIRRTDGPLWEEIAAVAAFSGVQVSMRMWWPGDDPEPWAVLDKPTMIVDVKQSEEAPNVAG